jgi:protein-disulfide isomerase
MKYSIAGALAALPARTAIFAGAIGFLALSASCARLPDQDTNNDAPAAAIHAEAPAANRLAAAAPQQYAECGAPKEDCGCDGVPVAPEVAGVEDVRAGASPSRGPNDAPVTVIVFADFQCPFCTKAQQTMEELEASYPGKVRIVYKNNPLPIHKSAKLAAKAALAANEQGRFWDYHDTLLEHQDALDPASLERYATDLGLDLARFRASMSSEALDAAVSADIAEAQRLSVRGTPTFFVNGRRVIGAQKIEAFRPLVDQALASL